MRKRYKPADVEFRMLKSRIDVAKHTGTWKEKLRAFLKGDKNAEVDRQTIDFLRVFLEWKERRSLRNGFRAEFTQHEKDAAKNAFNWLAANMQPELKQSDHARIAALTVAKCRKISRLDVTNFISTISSWNEDAKVHLFGRASMLLDTIDHSNSGKTPGDRVRFLGLAFRDKILLSPQAGESDIVFRKTAVHEMGHQHYKLDEPLCYALGEFYLLTMNGTTIENIRAELDKKTDKREGYLEGLAILEKAFWQKNPEKAFWDNIRRLSIQKQYQWL